MLQSDDEDDFISADEDGFDEGGVEANAPASDIKPTLPPAPPPTPALSSSFSNNEEPTLSSSPSLSDSQYGWRVPIKIPAAPVDPKSEQARLALDRLSEKLSQTDRNLFERVAADIKKVSIKSDEPPDGPGLSRGDQETEPALASISDLGSTLGGWGWSGASKLLSSASQVTSQVGSVLDSVVSQHLQQRPADKQTQDSQSKTSHRAEGHKASPNAQSSARETSEPLERSTSDSLPGEPLVDFTLNAMESLGKKAFDVMTTRDDSGSLQIKGLGRPWEHLLSLSKASEPQPKGEEGEGRDKDEEGKRRRRDRQDEADQRFEPDYSVAGESVVVESKMEDEDHQARQATSLKNRKRRNDHSSQYD